MLISREALAQRLPARWLDAAADRHAGLLQQTTPPQPPPAADVESSEGFEWFAEGALWRYIEQLRHRRSMQTTTFFPLNGAPTKQDQSTLQAPNREVIIEQMELQGAIGVDVAPAPLQSDNRTIRIHTKVGLGRATDIQIEASSSLDIKSGGTLTVRGALVEIAAGADVSFQQPDARPIVMDVEYRTSRTPGGMNQTKVSRQAVSFSAGTEPARRLTLRGFGELEWITVDSRSTTEGMLGTTRFTIERTNIFDRRPLISAGPGVTYQLTPGVAVDGRMLFGAGHRFELGARYRLR